MVQCHALALYNTCQKFGIKVWVLCEVKTGYGLEFQIYTGKSKIVGAEHGLNYRVVFYLLDNFFGSWQKFSCLLWQLLSYKLVNDPKNKSTFSCDTIRVDRGLFPVEFKKSKLEKNKSRFLEAGNIVAVYWKDQRDVYAMSAIHGSKIELVEKQNNDLVEKPRITCQYNK